MKARLKAIQNPKGESRGRGVVAIDLPTNQLLKSNQHKSMNDQKLLSTTVHEVGNEELDVDAGLLSYLRTELSELYG